MNFEPVLAEEKPDPWWKRIYAYVVISAIVTAFFAGAMFVYSYDLMRPAAHRQTMRNMTVEGHNTYVKKSMLVGAGIGVVLLGLYCFNEEWRHRREVKRARQK